MFFILESFIGFQINHKSPFFAITANKLFPWKTQVKTLVTDSPYKATNAILTADYFAPFTVIFWPSH